MEQLTMREVSPRMLGWYDSTKKKKPKQKWAEALARYRAKFGSEPTYCLTSPQDAAELAEIGVTITVRPRGFIQRYMYYLGGEE